MKEFIDNLVHYVNTLNLFAPIKVGSLDIASKALTVRVTPGPMDTRYLDGSREQIINFQILCKSPSQTECILTMDKLQESLELSSGDLTGSAFELIRCGTYVSYSLVEQITTGEYIYTALFEAEIERKM